MNSQNQTKYVRKTVSVQRGGFSDVRLWPCYMLFSGLILLLAPYVGVFWGIVLFFGPAFVLMSKVTARQPELASDRLAQYFESRLLALQELDREIPVVSQPQPENPKRRLVFGTSRPLTTILNYSHKNLLVTNQRF